MLGCVTAHAPMAPQPASETGSLLSTDSITDRGPAPASTAFVLEHGGVWACDGTLRCVVAATGKSLVLADELEVRQPLTLWSCAS
jgi:hypothetical protein